MGVSYLYFLLLGKFCANNRRYYMQGVSPKGGTLFLRPAKGGSRVLWKEKTIRMKRSD